MPTPFDRIYAAAKAKDEAGLKEALKTSPNNVLVVDTNDQSTKKIGTYPFTPVSLLAYEGNKEAIEFLLATASKFYKTPQDNMQIKKIIIREAAIGYAIQKNMKEIEQLVDDPKLKDDEGKTMATRTAIVFGLAIGGHIDLVNATLKLIDDSTLTEKSIKEVIDANKSEISKKILLQDMLGNLNEAIEGYLANSNIPFYRNQAKALLKKINYAIRDYAEAGETGQVILFFSNKTPLQGFIKKGQIYAAYGYGRSKNPDPDFSLDNLIKASPAHLRVKVLDNFVRGCAEANKIDLVNKLLQTGASKDYAIRGFAKVKNHNQVNKLLQNGANKDYALLGYAEAGDKKAVDKLIKEGAKLDFAILGYKKGGHQKELNELTIGDQYEKQKSRRNIGRFIIGAAAVVFTPISLLVSLPIWFWTKHRAPIQECKSSTNFLIKALDEMFKEKNPTEFQTVSIKENGRAEEVRVKQAALGKINSDFWQKAKKTKKTDDSAKPHRHVEIETEEKPTHNSIRFD